MSRASRYWKLVRLTASGRVNIEVLEEARAFLTQEFPDSAVVGVSDTIVQRQLVDRSREDNSQTARLCLRCFISDQIYQVCRQLEIRYGREHGFTCKDLLPFVLNDFPTSSVPRHSVYQSFALKVLQTFHSERGGLSTWTARLVKRDPGLTHFLLDRGVYLISDWAILNDAKTKQLRRIFSDFYHLTSHEIQEFCDLLDSYHSVYLVQRRQKRENGVKGLCLPPNETQLEQIRQKLKSRNQSSSSKEVMERLQSMAEKLRNYRIHVRGGDSQDWRISLDDREISRQVERQQKSQSEIEGFEEDFLNFYQNKFVEALDRSLETVTQSRLTRKRRKNSASPEELLKALHWFHCEGKSMTEIANTLGMNGQYQVTRMLKLKEFRADIRQQMLVVLLKTVLEKAKFYDQIDRLPILESQVEKALDEQIETEIESWTKEANIPQKRTCNSLFAKRLCSYLKKIVKQELAFTTESYCDC